MPSSESSALPTTSRGALRAAQVVVVSSVMFTFISYWRTAAVVLCDMSSTAYYIGAIVESAIGKAAPWFILAVLVFSYGIRSVYIESSALFVRGGVYRVVKEALGGFLAKLSVSALLFDYILTGPISGVSAGQYIVGLGLEALGHYGHIHFDESTKQAIKNWGSVAIACAITLYFFRENLRGIRESSDKALKIMIATTVMAVIMLTWCGITLAMRHANPQAYGPINSVPWRPDLTVKLDPVSGQKIDPLGTIGRYPSLAEPLRNPKSWLGLLGVIGLVIAFGHSILAMSGEETLGQVYREVESPKLPNFKKAAFIVFIYSLLLTGAISFLAVMLIPDNVRMKIYSDNFIGGLAMHMVGPPLARLLLNAFVVVIGFLILSGAVNTAIIGSNGVLSRVAEDGVLPDWFLKPHRRYGTNHRMLLLIILLQLFTIVISRGDVILLGEAYAFGVIWSFVFMTLAMVVLRFKDRTPREFNVPLNIRVGNVEVPIGLTFVFLIVFLSALANLATKEVATVSGLAFTGTFLAVFMVTEHFHERRLRGAKHEHIEQFNSLSAQVTTENLGLTKPYCKLVAIRSTGNLFMLEKALEETDPETTEVVVMTARIAPPGDALEGEAVLDTYDRQLMTAVVERAERAGKSVKPLFVPTNNPLHAVLKTAQELHAQELVVGASNKFTAEEQLDQIAFYWINLHDGQPPGLTVRILSHNRDVYFDLAGGNRIPKLSERKARTVEELRAAGVGVHKVLLVHKSTQASNDLFQLVLTMLDPQVKLDLVSVPAEEEVVSNGHALIEHDREQAKQLGRDLGVFSVDGQPGPEIVSLAREGHYGLIIMALPEPRAEQGEPGSQWADFVIGHAHCPVFQATYPMISREVEE